MTSCGFLAESSSYAVTLAREEIDGGEIVRKFKEIRENTGKA